MSVINGRKIGFAVLISATVALLTGSITQMKGAEMNTTEIDIEALDTRGQSIIFQRVMEEDMEGIAALLDAGLPVDIRGFQQSTPTLYAAMADIWPVVLFLLERGADPIAANQLGMTLPWLATTSRIAGDGPRAQALEDVRTLLAERGHLSVIYTLEDVRARLTEGDWPPGS